MTRPTITVTMYMPSCLATTSKSLIAMIFPQMRQAMPKGEYLEKENKHKQNWSLQHAVIKLMLNIDWRQTRVFPGSTLRTRSGSDGNSMDSFHTSFKNTVYLQWIPHLIYFILSHWMEYACSWMVSDPGITSYKNMIMLYRLVPLWRVV